MTIPVHHVGDLVRVSANFQNISDVDVDPTTVTLKVMDPSGNVDTYTYVADQITKLSTGNYYKDVSADEAGEWHAWWESTGTGEGAQPTEWVVEPTLFS